MSEDKPVQPSQTAISGDGSKNLQAGRDIHYYNETPPPPKQSSIVVPTNSQIRAYDPNVRRLLDEIERQTIAITITTMSMNVSPIMFLLPRFILNFAKYYLGIREKRAYFIVLLLMLVNLFLWLLIG